MIKRDEQSFTLIELAILISIMAIMAFVYITNFSTDSSSLMAAREKLMSDIRYLQSEAVSKRGRYGVEFLPDMESYSLYINSPQTKIKDPQDPDSDFTVNYTQEGAYNGIDLVGIYFDGAEVLEFDWRGIPYNASGLMLAEEGMIVLQNSFGMSVIKITPQTGKVGFSDTLEEAGGCSIGAPPRWR